MDEVIFTDATDGTMQLRLGLVVWEALGCRVRRRVGRLSTWGCSMLVTIRVRSVVWFVTGAVVAVVVMLLVLDAWRVEAAPGDVDTTFVPVTACRLADTRQGGSTPIGAGATRVFSAHGVNGLCTVPSTAVALSMNVTVDSRTAANSFLTVWRAGVPRPNSSSLNPALGEPPTPNAVITDLSPGGQFNVYNDAGSVHVLFDVNGYYIKSSLADLNARAAGLESQVAALNAKLASVSVVTVDGQPTVRFSGVNVQVVDGSGDTDGPVNGRGNLIVGYNANASDTRTGSHNLIVGDAHSYSSYGGLVAGFNNTVVGIWSSATAGRNNTASGEFSSVAGGVFSSATGEWSSVSGGEANIASGVAASVTGGIENRASGSRSSVSGGDTNTASGAYSSVSGGLENDATSTSASVSGGNRNTASGTRASVSGGTDNTASGASASVLGGASNLASGSTASVSGGSGNVGGAGSVSVAGGDAVICSLGSQVFVCGEGLITLPD